MEKEIPADWAIKKALCFGNSVAMDGHDVRTVDNVKRSALTHWGQTVIALARYIEANEPAPVDRKLLCAREAAFHVYYEYKQYDLADKLNGGEADNSAAIRSAVAAITLYESGFGKD